MGQKYTESVFLKVVDALSDYDSFKDVYHQHVPGVSFPSNERLKEIVELCRSILFPGYFGNSDVEKITIKYHIGCELEKLANLLYTQVLAGLCFDADNDTLDIEKLKDKSQQIVSDFVSGLPKLRELLITDVEAAYIGDPAAKSRAEIFLCYPAVRTISSYRIAHSLLVLGVPYIPRMISEMAHSETGIDIHPGATIGSYFTIDHGTGVVVGETAILGNHVKLYQGVTLGAKSFQLDENGNPIKDLPRHPILKDNVVVYANATILGRITIGEGAVIGGNVWVTHDVPDGGKVVQQKTAENKPI